MRTKTKIVWLEALMVSATGLLGGCATLQPPQPGVTEAGTYYAVWDLPTKTPYQVIARAVVALAKERTGGASVSENPPPHIPPETPGDVQVADSETVTGKPLNIGHIHITSQYYIAPDASHTEVVLYVSDDGPVRNEALANEVLGAAGPDSGAGPVAYTWRTFVSLNNKLSELSGGCATLSGTPLVPKGPLLAASSPAIKAAEAACAASTYRRLDKEAAAGNWTAAQKILHAARRGVMPAQLYAGFLYANGWGVMVNHAAAITWWKRTWPRSPAAALDLGDVYADAYRTYMRYGAASAEHFCTSLGIAPPSAFFPPQIQNWKRSRYNKAISLWKIAAANPSTARTANANLRKFARQVRQANANWP